MTHIPHAHSIAVTEHALRDTHGSEWSFWVDAHAPQRGVNVEVRSHWQRGAPNIIWKHECSFSRELLNQLHPDDVRTELARARLLGQEYPFADFHNHTDIATDRILVGVRIRFPAPRYTVTLALEDARRLWRNLTRY